MRRMIKPIVDEYRLSAWFNDMAGVTEPSEHGPARRVGCLASSARMINTKHKTNEYVDEEKSQKKCSILMIISSRPVSLKTHST